MRWRFWKRPAAEKANPVLVESALTETELRYQEAKARWHAERDRFFAILGIDQAPSVMDKN